jgi:hypothetical protein
MSNTLPTDSNNILYEGVRDGAGTQFVAKAAGTVTTDGGGIKSAPLLVQTTDGADATLGAQADAAYVSGSGSVVALLKGLFAKLAATLTVSGTVTANAGTNLNTSLLALESGGHLASLDTHLPAQGQAAMASSVPVVIASNQSAVPTNIAQVNGAVPSTANPLPAAIVGTPDYGTSQVEARYYANGVGAMLNKAARPRPISGFTSVWQTTGIPTNTVPGDWATAAATAYLSPIWNCQRFDENWVHLTSTTAGAAVSTTASSAVSSTGSQTVTLPATAASLGIGVGMYLTYDTGASQEMVVVTAAPGSTFTAMFSKTHLTSVAITAPPLIVAATYEDVYAYDWTGVYWQFMTPAVPTAQLLMLGTTITPHYVWQWSEADLIATSGQQPAMSRRARAILLIWQEGTSAGAIRGGFGWRTALA